MPFQLYCYDYPAIYFPYRIAHCRSLHLKVNVSVHVCVLVGDLPAAPGM